jgi:hypothetical protein
MQLPGHRRLTALTHSWNSYMSPRSSSGVKPRSPVQPRRYPRRVPSGVPDPDMGSVGARRGGDAEIVAAPAAV